MKKRVYTINKKRLVEGDANLVTKDEILVEKKNGKYNLLNNKGENISGNSNASFSKALYYVTQSDSLGLDFYNDSSGASDTEVRTYGINQAIVYSTVTSGLTLYNFKPKYTEHYYGTSITNQDYGTEIFNLQLYEYVSKLRYNKYGNISEGARERPSITNLELSALKEEDGLDISSANPIIRRIIKNLPIKSGYKNALLTEGELMKAVRNTFKSFSDISNLSPGDSPIVWVGYTLDSTSGKHKIISNIGLGAYNNFYAYNKPYISYNTSYTHKFNLLEGNYNYSTSTDSSEIKAEPYYAIPEGKFSTEDGSAVFFIYNVAEDKFYPILHA